VLGAGSLTTGANNTSTTFSGAISGAGALVKTGSGILTLSGSNTYTGTTSVNGGSLRAATANTFSAASGYEVNSGATLATVGHDQTVASLVNSGTVSLVGAAAGSELTVKGAYVGKNGILSLGTVLSDVGPADKLVLDGPGASASGQTTVRITNLGGLGAKTTGNGIEVIAARNGATTTAQSTADAFVLGNGTTPGNPLAKAALGTGHVDAGAYEYRLFAADGSGAGQSWYLRSELPPTPPPATGTSNPPAPAAAPIPLYRAEVPLLAALPAQLRQASVAMLGNQHQRVGDEGAPLAGSAASAGKRGAWGRIVVTDLELLQKGVVAPHSSGHLTGFQAGTDLWTSAEWHAGLYAGQLDGKARVSGFARGVSGPVGSNDLRSQFLGGYASYANADGLYADAVVQAGRHRYTAAPDSNLPVSGKGRSLVASIEVGQSFALSERWEIEPQLQLVHQRLALDDTQISGARVQQRTANDWLVRAGVRVKGKFATGAGILQPYARVNVYQAGGSSDIARFIGPAAATDIASGGRHAFSELAAGLTLTMSPNTSVYGELGRLWAGGGNAKQKSSAQGSLGLRVRW